MRYATGPQALIGIGIVTTIVVCLALFHLQVLDYYFNSTPPYQSEAGENDLLCVPAARYLDPQALLYPSEEGGELDIGLAGGVPKIIHQSWVDDNLPARFNQWSDSLRLRHPDWRWVLWTDRDNAELVASRHPHLNESYWALELSIERADFVRNLYMWEFGGVYADLDMDSLRPLDTLFTPPFRNLNPSYSMSSSSGRSSSLPDLAFVGSMETTDESRQHSIPNAFMASSPHHPFWLLPISRVLQHYKADVKGQITHYHHKGGSAESMTGPEALLRSVETYREWKETEGDKTNTGLAISNAVHSCLAHYDTQAATHHDVLVLDTGVIYPFSWLTDKHSQVHRVCRAAPEFHLDPIKCQDACQAYERGARMITYWSHTWSPKGKGKDLSVVGHR